MTSGRRRWFPICWWCSAASGAPPRSSTRARCTIDRPQGVPPPPRSGAARCVAALGRGGAAIVELPDRILIAEIIERSGTTARAEGTGNRQQATGGRRAVVPVACCLLPVASCLLPVRLLFPASGFYGTVARCLPADASTLSSCPSPLYHSQHKPSTAAPSRAESHPPALRCPRRISRSSVSTDSASGGPCRRPTAPSGLPSSLPAAIA